jgi:hypothetical protein
MVLEGSFPKPLKSDVGLLAGVQKILKVGFFRNKKQLKISELKNGYAFLLPYWADETV